MSGVHWVARCRYPGLDSFVFDSPAFVISHWSELESVAHALVAAEWAKISPHPPPGIVELIPGFLEHVTPECAEVPHSRRRNARGSA